ncbi:MAG: prolyl oligopeptidase family serine peptidase [Balneolaceae bacterium]
MKRTTEKRTMLTVRLRTAILPFLVFVFTAASLNAQGITPYQIATMEAVTSVELSDDGMFAAYTVSVPADPYKENAGNRTELHILNLQTNESRPYYTQGGISGVAFRPGHRSVTFVTSQPGDAVRALYELPLGGGEAVKLFAFERSISAYSWHPDGNHIVFSSFDNPETSSSPLPYTADVFEENLPQRPAYITNVARDGHTPHRIEVEGTVYMMEWSPSGDRIALSVAPSPGVDDSFMAQQVVIVDYRTRQVAAEVNNEGKLGQIVWSPQGDRLALRAGRNIHDPIDGRILIVSASGGTPEKIDLGYEGKYEHIAWTGPNQIHFRASESTASVLGSIRPNGTQKQTLFRSSTHAIGTFSRADNGTLAFVASTPQHPNELFVLQNRRNAQPERKTHHNAWLDDVELGRQEVITYTTRDGEFEIDGILIYPVGYEAGTAVPLINMIHGGPEAHYSNGWLTNYSMPGQMAAAKGYAVFYPNYRGSTGRGTEFVYSSQADLAGKEFDDIVDGVDALIDRGIADANRIGVTGGSYGGYASAWMSTYYSDRFAAAVMFVGISNNLSKWGTSDIPDELYLVHSRERMWESDEKWLDYLKRSPIYWVDRAQTPILIMHGANDTRVHPAQSLELYRHLKVRKPEVPARLVWYPGEGHGNTRAASRYDYTHRMLQWFDTYLMTGDSSAELPHWDAPVPERE